MDAKLSLFYNIVNNLHVMQVYGDDSLSESVVETKTLTQCTQSVQHIHPQEIKLLNFCTSFPSLWTIATSLLTTTQQKVNSVCSTQYTHYVAISSDVTGKKMSARLVVASYVMHTLSYFQNPRRF